MRFAMFEIKKNVPVPSFAKANSGAIYASWPFGRMEVGDSFSVPANMARKMRAAASAFSCRKGLRFTCKKTSTDGEVTCWRVM